MPTTKQEKLDGFISVTEVLDFFIPKGLLDWYLRTGKSESKRLSTVAMKIGTRVDELIQQDVVDGRYKLTSKDSIEVRNCMEAWNQFKQDYSPVIKATQTVLVDAMSKVTGHSDIITDNTLIDVKCSSSIRDNYWIQVSKYYDMIEVDEFQTVSRVAVLRLDKNLGTYEYKTDIDAKISKSECVRVFDGLLAAYRYYNPQRGTEVV